MYQFFFKYYSSWVIFFCIKNTQISVFPVKEENFANCGSTKVFSYKFSPLMTKCLCIPPLLWLRDWNTAVLWLWAEKVPSHVVVHFLFSPWQWGGIATWVCMRVIDAASINHKQFQENILKTYCFLGDLLHLQPHTSDPAAYRIWLSAIRAEYLNMVTAKCFPSHLWFFFFFLFIIKDLSPVCLVFVHFFNVIMCCFSCTHCSSMSFVYFLILLTDMLIDFYKMNFYTKCIFFIFLRKIKVLFSSHQLSCACFYIVSSPWPPVSLVCSRKEKKKSHKLFRFCHHVAYMRTAEK